MSAPEVLCVGEAMIVVGRHRPGRLTLPGADLRLGVGGAEANVARTLARLGVRTAWWSRLGADPFGSHVLADLRAAGVDVADVARDEDPARPTGVYFKDQDPAGPGVYYYRSTSAAAAMTPTDLVTAPRPTRVVHTTGITAGISPGGLDVVRALLTDRLGAADVLTSFDVNHRPALWRDGEGARVLLALARLADLVLVGRDEAEGLWGTPDADAVRALLPDVPGLVVKDAEHGATWFQGSDRTHVPAPAVEVVEPVGAGDAFAAGLLAATVRGRGPQAALRQGHVAAAAALTSHADVPEELDARTLEAAAATGPAA